MSAEDTDPTPDPTLLSWTFRAHSEIGLVRKNNQDSGFVGRQLLVVADGMGGAAAGDLASAVAVDSIKTIDDSSDADDADPAPDQPARGATDNLSLLNDAILQANRRIADLVSADFTLEGMGTTVTAALVDHDQLSLAHIGDSRAYLWRDERLERLTHDHSWVQSLIDDGKISADEAAVHPHRSLLLKVLNGHPANEPDLTTVALQTGDRLLFCSDGLCGFVEDDELAVDLAIPDLDRAMAAMVEAAHDAGGPDNITIILAEVSAAEISAADGDGTVMPAVPQVLGAAAEREIPDLDTMARHRLVPDDDSEELDEDGGSAGSGGRSDDEDRYAPQPPARRKILRPLAGLVVLVLVLGAAVGAGYAWSRTQYFVGDDAGQVAIFRGISGTPSALHLAEVYEVQQLPISTLPPLYQSMVSSAIDVADLNAARATVEQLRQGARVCQTQRGTVATNGAKPSTSPSTTSSARTAATPTPTPGASSTPGSKTPSPSARTNLSATPTSTSSGVLPPGGQSC